MPFGMSLAPLPLTIALCLLGGPVWAAPSTTAIAVRIRTGSSGSSPRAPAAEKAAHAAIRAATQGQALVDAGDAFDALKGMAFSSGDDLMSVPLPDATRADVARAAATCDAQAGYGNPASFDAERSLCRAGLGDVLWQRHVAHLGVDRVVIVEGSDDTPPPEYAALMHPKEMVQGYGLTVYTARVAADGGPGRMLQVRRVADVAGFVKHAIGALEHGDAGMRWPAWRETLPEVPGIPTPPPSFEVFLAGLNRSAEARDRPPVAVKQRAWCRGPMPSSLELTPDGPFARLVTQRYKEALVQGSSTWKLTARRPGDDPQVPGPPARGTLTASLTPATVPTGTPGEILSPARAFLSVDVEGADGITAMVAEPDFDNAEAIAAKLVGGFIDRQCTR